MTSPALGRQRALGIALVVLAATVPLALAGPATAQASCDDIDVVGYITLTHPLREQITASELAYLVVAEQHDLLRSNRNLINGIDSYVVDLFCDVTSATYLVTATGDGDCDPAVKFLDRQLGDKGYHNNAGGATESGFVPPGSHYAVVVLEDGPVVSGLTPVFPTRPYSCRVQFEMGV